MDNDTKKILLLIARALQVNALAQAANVGVYGGDGVALLANPLAQAASANRFNAWREDIKKQMAIAAALLAKIENEEKQREAAEKYMYEIYRKGEEAVEKHKEEIRRKSDEAGGNNV